MAGWYHAGMTKKQVQQLTILLATVIVVIWQQYRGIETEAAPNELPQRPAATSTVESTGSIIETNALVLRAVDGDTIEARLDGADETAKIRLLGVNTPESVDPRRGVECFGKAASQFTKETLEGRRIRLVEDPQADNVDKYQRLLRNVVTENGTDFNLYLVQQGYANAYLDFPLNKQRKAQLSQAEKLAREAGLGLWSTSTCSGTK